MSIYFRQKVGQALEVALKDASLLSRLTEARIMLAVVDSEHHKSDLASTTIEAFDTFMNFDPESNSEISAKYFTSLVISTFRDSGVSRE